MEEKDDLFQLIKSLSGNEKRYFRMYSKLQGGDKNYLGYFDELDKLSAYDEKDFKWKHRGKSFIKNFAWRKHHLYDSVLFALEEYHHSADSDIYRLIHRAEILFEKSLLKQALKVLQKAKIFARRNESFPLLLEILRWEETVAIKFSDSEKQIAVAKEMKEAHKLFANAMEHKNILNEVYNLHHSLGFFRAKKDENTIKHILRSKMWKDESTALSLKAKRYFYYSHFIYNFMKGDLKRGYAYCKQSTETFFSNPNHITYNPQIYINALNALLYSCSALHRYDEMITHIRKFRETKTYFTKNHLGSAILLSYHELDYYTQTGKTQDGFFVAKRIERELLENETALSSLEKTGLLINLSMMYFLNEKYRETIALLNRVMYEPVLNSRVDMDSMVRIFYIVAHYERGVNRQFMKSLVRSTYRRLGKQKTLHKFETIILTFIRKKLFKANTEQKLILAFIILRKQLLILKKDAYESRPLEYFDLIAWLESKIEKKSFAEVVRK